MASKYVEYKRQRNSLTLELKMKVLQQFNNGVRPATITREFGLPESTVRTIIKNKDKIQCVSKRTTKRTARRIRRSRNPLLDKMENLLITWIGDMNKDNIYLSQDAICSKAKSIFDSLKSEEKDPAIASINFGASKGWYDRFKRRSNLNAYQNTHPKEYTDLQAASEFSEELQKTISEKNYSPDVVFNVQKTYFYWKKIPSASGTDEFINHAETSKNRLQLLMGGNATGEHKLIPLLVYSSETPFCTSDLMKNILPVVSRSNKAVCITKEILTDWFLNTFCPSVKSYCDQKGLESRVLLLMETNIDFPMTAITYAKSYLDVQIMTFPPSAASILQPMSQGLFTNFIAYYNRRTYNQLIYETQGKEKEIIDEWWKSYNIVDAIENITEAWQEVKPNSMNESWSKLWPAVVKTPYGIDVDTQEVIKSIVAFTEKSLQPEFTGYLQDFMSWKEQPMLNEDLVEIQIEENESISESEDSKILISSTIIKQALAQIYSALDILEKHDPDVKRVSTVRKTITESVSCYEKELTWV